MINQQRDRIAPLYIEPNALQLPLLHELVVKLDEKQSLILHVCEQIVLSDEIEHVWTAQT
jgi:hypothetical protein